MTPEGLAQQGWQDGALDSAAEYDRELNYLRHTILLHEGVPTLGDLFDLDMAMLREEALV
jgi:hypothetical protein